MHAVPHVRICLACTCQRQPDGAFTHVNMCAANLLFPVSQSGVKAEALQMAADTAATSLWEEHMWVWSFKIQAWLEENRHRTQAPPNGPTTAVLKQMIAWYDQAILTNAMKTWREVSELGYHILQRAVDAGLEVAAKVPPAMAVPRPPQPAPGPRPTPGAGRGSGAGGGAKKNARKSKAKNDSRGWSKGRANGSGAGGSKPRTRAHPQSVSTGAHAAVALLDLTCYEYCC